MDSVQRERERERESLAWRRPPQSLAPHLSFFAPAHFMPFYPSPHHRCSTLILLVLLILLFPVKTDVFVSLQDRLLLLLLLSWLNQEETRRNKKGLVLLMKSLLSSGSCLNSMALMLISSHHRIHIRCVCERKKDILTSSKAKNGP